MNVTDIPASFPLWWRLLASLFFIGLALMGQGFAIWMVYEASAIFTRAVPTISFVTSFSFLHHPVWWALGIFIVGVALGGLITHITHWTP